MLEEKDSSIWPNVILVAKEGREGPGDHSFHVNPPGYAHNC